MHPKYIRSYEKLLAGGIWCIVDLTYFYNEDEKKTSPFVINEITPIQMPNLDKSEIIEARSQFTKEEWIDLLLRSCGMEPTQFDYRVKWHLLTRLVPLVENNVNICELGPRGTGKSHIYKELSPNSILISGGQTTVANLFYNMGRRQVGLVGLWDCVAFDEVAGINFKDKDGVQIMKDYMAYDASKEEAISYGVPCAEIVEKMKLCQLEYDGYYYDQEGQLAFFDTALTKQKAGIIIRKDILDKFLLQMKMQLVWFVNGSKEIHLNDLSIGKYSDWTGVLKYDGVQVVGEIYRTERMYE